MNSAKNGEKARPIHNGQRWSNADEDRVVIEAYDPRWPQLYTSEEASLRAAIADQVGLRVQTDYRLHHVGSTAVQKLAAKPIIDILMVVDDREVWSALVEPIEALGYLHWANDTDPEHMFFVKGMPPHGEQRSHHVHVRPPNQQAKDTVVFRDYLRAHPAEARRYAQLKERLADEYATDRRAYTDAKTDLIEQMLRRAKHPDV